MSTLHLGLALDGAGAHPAAWQLPGIATTLLDPVRLVALAQTAERAGFDFVSLDDSLDPSPVGAPPYRLDALLALARVAPATSAIGLLATVTTTHTEPFHISKNVATLDLVSGGRGAWQVAVSTSEEATRRFGRKPVQPLAELWAEAEDAIEVVSRLWDSWEDDAIIRDRPTGRYLDREKVHYIDFEGRFFSVRGPSITPRSPQGQPLIAIAAADEHSSAVAARRADLVIVHAPDSASARIAREQIRRAAEVAGRNPDDISVLVAARVGEPERRASLERIEASAGRAGLDLVGDAANVASTLVDWHASGAADGFLLQPDTLSDTLAWLAGEVLPELALAGHASGAPAGATLRDRSGLPRPTNRYALPEVAR